MADIGAVLAAEIVTFCVDTNLLVEFQALESLQWRQLAPNATEIRVIIPTKVTEEMDEHKKKTGRLRRRGIEFSATARAIEESASGRLELRAADPRVTIEFGPTFRRSQLDADLFELDDPDGRVVAEVAAIAQKVPDVVLLADDSKPIRLARHAELLCSRPVDSWRRSEGPDERDTTISELKREIGATPVLSISFPSAVDDRHRHIIEPAGESTPPEIARTFSHVVTEVCNQRVPRSDIIAKHGLRPHDLYGFGLSAFSGAPGVTNDQLSEYERDFDRYVNLVEHFARQLHKVFNVRGPALPVMIDVGNDGDRAAERVLVEAELTGDFRFIPPDSVQDAIRRFLTPPKPPRPDTLPFHLQTPLVPFAPAEPRRGDVFYEQDEATLESDTRYLSWRCEELRQGVHHDLPATIAASGPGAVGALKVTISGAFMDKKRLSRRLCQ